MTHAAQDVASKLTPFLKWAGGKRWLVNSGADISPAKYDTYIEPFLGSAAVFFSERPTRAVLTDTNDELINVYVSLRDEPDKVERNLKLHSRNHSDAYYYLIRARRPRKKHTRAARFLYLNRTCWNGLYRVNLKGEFNVPKGTKNTVVLETDNLPAISKLLKHCQIECQDFETTIDQAAKGDFVFIDPPYTVKHNHNGFVKYNETIFSWDDQLRLAASIERAIHRGAAITMTNADHPSIHELYAPIGTCESLNRNSIIAASSTARTKTTETLYRFGW